MATSLNSRAALRSPRGTRGSAAFSGLLWLLALALFVAPFLRPADNIGSYEGDFGRDVVPDSDEDKIDVPFAVDVANYEADHGPGLAKHIADASEQLDDGRGIDRTGAEALADLESLSRRRTGIAG